MRFNIFLPLFFVLFLAGTSYGNKRELVDGICAMVDSEPILESEILDKIKNGPLVEFSDYPSDSNPKASERERALNDAINIRLVKRKAEDSEIQVKKEQIDKRIDEILSQRGPGYKIENLQEDLAKQHRSLGQLRKHLADQILFSRFKGRFIIPLAKVNDSDLEAYYMKKQGSSPDAAVVSLRKIVIPIENELMAVKKQNLANEVYEKLKSGLSFDKAQSLYSPDIPNGATDFRIKDLSGTIGDEVRDLKVKEFTKPIRVGETFIIFYIQEKHILANQEFLRQKTALEQELHVIEVNRQMNLWLQQSRDRAKITILKKN